MATNTAGMRGKDDERKLFVGGLPRLINEKQIRDTFSQYGTVESINVKVDPMTGQPRGFCFIVFTESSVVEKILEMEEVTVLGKKVDPRKVTKTSQPGKFFVGGITTDLSEDTLREYFGQFGKITELQWPFDKVKNQKKAYCFITLENKESVNEVLKKPKQTINGVELDVKKVKFNPETMWAGAGPYARGPRGFPPYGQYPPYGGYGYDDGYGYDEYYAAEGMDPYYDGYTTAYDSYAPPPYATPPYARGPRGRAPGYARHAPY